MSVLPVCIGRFALYKVSQSVKEETECCRQAKGDEGLFGEKLAKLLFRRHIFGVIKGRVAGTLLTGQSKGFEKDGLIGPLNRLRWGRGWRR